MLLVFVNKGREMQQSQEDLKKPIKESIREVFREERLGLYGTMTTRVPAFWTYLRSLFALVGHFDSFFLF